MELYAKFEFNSVRLSWFSTMQIFLGAQNQNMCQVSADAKKIKFYS